MGYKHKNMTRLLKQEWKLVGMAKETMTDLVHHLQLVITEEKKNHSNQSSTFATINQYLGQALYNWFKNIDNRDKVLGFNKFFCCLGTIVRQYKTKQMLVVIWVLNNITVHRLIIAYNGMPSNSYCHQITNVFRKLLDQEDVKNTSMITILIFLVFRMYIGITRLLKDGTPIAEFDANKRLRLESTSLD